jgi:hypothetical protein
MTMSPEDGIERAYRAFLDVAAAAPAALRSSRPGLSPIDEEDAELFLAGLIEGAMQFVAADAAQPAFVPWVTPARRWMDNGADSVYWMAPVDGDHRYRISGRRGDECYLSFTLYAGDPGHPERVVRNDNHRDLGVQRGETFAFTIDPPPDACYVISRQYFTEPSLQPPGRFTIDAVDGTSGARAPGLAVRWSAATTFLRAMTRPATGAQRPPAYVSTTPNVMGDPSVWTETEGGGRGTPDQTYALGPYALGPDDALVMDVTFPACAYASAAVWNRFSQTVDRRFHRSTINHTEAVPGRDGSTRVVLAHRDPGVDNWLDTGGRERGTIFWRFLLAEHPPGPISTRVVHLDDVAPN